MAIARIVLAAALALGAALPAAAQSASVKLKGKLEDLWRSHAYTINPGTTHTIFEIPEDRRLVLTDVVLANPHASEVLVSIDSGATTTIELRLEVPAGGTFAHAFATGIPFEPGAELRVLYTVGPAPIEIHLTGLLLRAK